MAQNILNSNPDARAFMQQMQSDCGQRDPKEFALELCKSKGVNTDFVMQLANMMGLKQFVPGINVGNINKIYKEEKNHVRK